MIAQQVREFTVKIDTAISAQNFDDMRLLTVEADKFLRHELPLASESSEDPVTLVTAISELSQQFERALTIAKDERDQTYRQLQTFRQQKNNASEYLSVSQQLPR